MDDAREIKRLIADLKAIIQKAESLILQLEQRANDIERKTK